MQTSIDKLNSISLDFTMRNAALAMLIPLVVSFISSVQVNYYNAFGWLLFISIVFAALFLFRSHVPWIFKLHVLSVGCIIAGLNYLHYNHLWNAAAFILIPFILYSNAGYHRYIFAYISLAMASSLVSQYFFPVNNIHWSINRQDLDPQYAFNGIAGFSAACWIIASNIKFFARHIAEFREELRGTQSKLQNNESRLNNIIQNAPVAFYRGKLTDNQIRLEMISEQIEKITGISSTTYLSNRNFFEEIQDEDKKKLESEIKQQVLSSKNYTIEYQLKTEDGQLVNVVDKGIGLYNDQEDAFYLDGMIHNVNLRQLEDISEAENGNKKLNGGYGLEISELKVANIELLKAIDELSEKNRIISDQKESIQEALNNLKTTQSKLVHSEKMASLGLLTAGVAHELNNPLNFILGGYSSLEEHFNEQGPINKNLELSLESIRIGIIRASSIISSLNVFTRENDDMNEECNVLETLDNAIVMLQHKLHDKIEVVKKYEFDIPSIKGNEGKLHQVFLNILRNAIEAMPKEGLLVVRATLENDEICIMISDTGSGIDESILEQIKDPFFTTKEPGKGTGLGLYLSNQIIEDHGGKLVYESSPNVGTKAIIYLPLNRKNNES